jgi:hypothetical protein
VKECSSESRPIILASEKVYLVNETELKENNFYSRMYDKRFLNILFKTNIRYVNRNRKRTLCIVARMRRINLKASTVNGSFTSNNITSNPPLFV